MNLAESSGVVIDVLLGLLSLQELLPLLPEVLLSVFAPNFVPEFDVLEAGFAHVHASLLFKL